MQVRILTVCTGNIVRSPLAEQYLRHQLAGAPIRVTSVGTSARAGEAMTNHAQRIAADLGVPTAEYVGHGARRLTERDAAAPDLVLAMTRAHRKAVVELDPRRLRSTFTVREFARLAEQVPDPEVADAAASAGADPRARLRAALARVAAVRGTVDPPADPADDDVLDPAGRSWNTYETSMRQLLPATDEVVRVIRAALA